MAETARSAVSVVWGRLLRGGDSGLREVFELLRNESRARVFFLALTQSGLGTGAAYVALLLVAYERFDSPWAIGLILFADVAPAMLLGPVFGAVADRWSRRACLVTADVLRAGAFAAILMVDSFEATFGFALLVGIGTGLFTPAALASLPSLVEKRRLPAATSLYGAATDLGFIAGPGIAALLLVLGGPETILAGNAVTFGASALLLAPLAFGQVAAKDTSSARPSLMREARDGLAATIGMRGLRLILLASATVLLFGALFNVAELLLVQDVLGGGGTAFSILVVVYGGGFIAGTVSGSKGGGLLLLRRRYLGGVLIMSTGYLVSGIAPSLLAVGAAFAVAGFGNGVLLVYERLLIQRLVPDRLAGRVFGVKDALTAWAFALGFLLGPAMIELLGVRELVVAAGVGGLVVWLVAFAGLRGRDLGPEPEVFPEPELLDARGQRFRRDRSAGEERPDLVRG